ncbi:hypothetical protein BT67DRAFT_288634, partial [Trichocladium antarcticum]
MPGWRLISRAWRIAPRQLQRRHLSTPSIEHIRVPCASSGAITLSLHNISQHHATAPLAIFIPPFSPPGAEPTPLPPCLRDHPAAVLNYRWPLQGEEDPESPLHWPTPLHDVLFGYSWLAANLGVTRNDTAGPPDTTPGPVSRSAYVFGSYLGASLAAGLALTESHFANPLQPMTVRGLIAHNGIYNWTMFLPDHPIHKPKPKPPSAKGRRRGLLPLSTLDDDTPPTPTEEDGVFAELKHHAPALFSAPAHLFDPFASACLFFHSPNLHVPDDFTTPLAASTSDWTNAIDALATQTPPGGQPQTTTSAAAANAHAHAHDPDSADALLAHATLLAKQARPPRKGYMVFPPRQSTLRLPDALLLYDAPRKPG